MARGFLGLHTSLHDVVRLHSGGFAVCCDPNTHGACKSLLRDVLLLLLTRMSQVAPDSSYDSIIDTCRKCLEAKRHDSSGTFHLELRSPERLIVISDSATFKLCLAYARVGLPATALRLHSLITHTPYTSHTTHTLHLTHTTPHTHHTSHTTHSTHAQSSREVLDLLCIRNPPQVEMMLSSPQTGSHSHSGKRPSRKKSKPVTSMYLPALDRVTLLAEEVDGKTHSVELSVIAGGRPPSTLSAPVHHFKESDSVVGSLNGHVAVVQLPRNLTT